MLAFALGASSAGAALGLLKQRDPDRRSEGLAFTAAAAVEVARTATRRADDATKALAAAHARMEALAATAQEIADWQEAERIGLPRIMKDSTALWGDDRQRVMAAIVRESRRNGLDPALVAALIHVESGFNPFAESHAGARGLMQLMPPTAQWMMEKVSGRPRIHPAHLFNPVLNIELGTTYLAHLMDRFDGDLTRALIAYNAGPSVARALRRGTPSWHRLSGYPRTVLAVYRTLLTPAQQVAAR